MDTIEYRNIDKAAWDRGPWDDEPDKMQFPDEATGLPCLIVRGPMGALCGYVGVAKGHPAFGKDYDDVDVDIHGGLTFADKCQTYIKDAAQGVCHVPGDGEPHDIWWLGFDCAHAWDHLPGSSEMLKISRYGGLPETYRDVEYVKEQIRDLAAQLANMENCNA